MTDRDDRPTAFGKNPPRVLVVEDDKLVHRLLLRVLGQLGCVVVGARTGAEARSYAATAAWDVVFLDLGLPDIDGLDLLPELAALQLQRPPTFVVLSGRPVGEHEVSDGVRVLMKPVDIYALMVAAKAAVLAARS